MTTDGAEQGMVIFTPSRLIGAPKPVYPSMEAAVPTTAYGWPSSPDASFTRSLMVPEPTATPRAPEVRSASRTVSQYS